MSCPMLGNENVPTTPYHNQQNSARRQCPVNRSRYHDWYGTLRRRATGNSELIASYLLALTPAPWPLLLKHSKTSSCGEIRETLNQRLGKTITYSGCPATPTKTRICWKDQSICRCQLTLPRLHFFFYKSNALFLQTLSRPKHQR